MFGNLTRSLTQRLTNGLTDRRANFTPGGLFTGGVPGLALDLTDMSKLYQDSARTTLVTATSQPIGSPTDLSGNGNHPTQATAGSRPSFTGFAACDGVDDGWGTGAIDFSGTPKVTVVAGLRSRVNTTNAVVLELSATSSANNGTFALFCPLDQGGAVFGHTFRSRGTVLAGSTPQLANLGNAYVLTGEGDIANDVARLRANGVLVGTGSGDQGSGNFGNFPLYIGRRAGSSLPAAVDLYRLIVIGRQLSAAELAQAERWCAAPMGIAIP